MTFGPIFIDHIGIATNELEPASRFWELIGLVQGDSDEVVADQGVKTRFFSTSTPFDGKPSKIELLEPTSAETPIGRFLSKRGPGIQQLCFRVGNLEGLLAHLMENGVRLIDEVPRLGAGGMKIAFVHPSSTGGVLVELAQA
ncbi:MAG: methylmalonyl-CoA epimerase [Candidatus Poseidoniales archaeon]|nr:MAG: methylmalonyl-CoA epimerase [Candidatus Poseidoniales archaeon]